MVMDQLNLIKNQTKAQLRNKASGTAANIRRETSLVQQAGRLTGRVKRGLENAEQTIVLVGLLPFLLQLTAVFSRILGSVDALEQQLAALSHYRIHIEQRMYIFPNATVQP